MAATAAAATQGNSALALTPTQTQSQSSRGKNISEREQVQTKLDFALALSHLGTGAYEKAATAFLKLGPADQLGDWIGKVSVDGLIPFPRDGTRTKMTDRAYIYAVAHRTG